MIKSVKNRLISLVSVFVIMMTGIFFVIYNFNENIMYYYTPSQVYKISGNVRIKIGGMVKFGSLIKENGIIFFDIQDVDGSLLKTQYSGKLTSIFREGQGVVVTGIIKNGIFFADELLTKHDETYKPPKNYQK